MKLETAFRFGIGLLVLAGLATAVTMIFITDHLHAKAREIEEITEGIYNTEELQLALLLHNRETFLHGVTGERIHACERDQARQRMQELIQRLEGYIAAGEERKLWERCKDSIARYVAEREGSHQGATDALADYQRTTSFVEESYRLLDGLNRINIQEARQYREEIARNDTLANLLGLGIIGVLAATFVFLIWGYRHFVYLPFRALEASILELGAGRGGARASTEGLREVASVAAVFNDLADRLERNKEAQLQFLGSIAHDIRNPLLAIRMAAEFNQSGEGGSPPTQQRDFAEVVKQQAVYLDRLVLDLLDTVRIEAGRIEIRIETVEMGQLVGEAARLHRDVSQTHAIVCTLPEKPVLCRCDPVRISQALNNLLSNAIKYSPYGGDVKLRMVGDEEEICISVSDCGMGISPEDQESIFEPFRRSQATRDTIPGVGLGLSASRRIIEAHGGRIEVESRLNEGSAFRIHLPAWKPPRGGERVEAPRGLARRKPPATVRSQAHGDGRGMHRSSSRATPILLCF